jgi:hypothetical protein
MLAPLTYGALQLQLDKRFCGPFMVYFTAGVVTGEPGGPG